jgi:acetyl esterase/lipase
MSIFHPELRAFAALFPRFTWTPRFAKLMNWFHALRELPPPRVEGLSIRDALVTAHDGADIPIRIYQPTQRAAAMPCMLWIHGGGYLFGTLHWDEKANIALACALGITIVAVNYRLPPRCCFPIPLEDCYSALRWVHDNAAALCVSRGHIAVGGSSAGGGLAAALAQLTVDRGEVPIAFQFLKYPMLDDRTAVRSDIDHRRLHLWSQRSNFHGWSAYLAQSPGQPDVQPYAVSSRRASLKGLPPAWIGVGALDLFHDESVAYAQRLLTAGVPCDLHVVPGAFHGFDVVRPGASIAKEFRASGVAALSRALQPSIRG